MPIDLSGALNSSFEKAKSEHKKALEVRNYEKAEEKASECARLLRALAKNDSDRRKEYLDSAANWDKAAKGELKIKVKRTHFEDGTDYGKKGGEEDTEDKFDDYIKGLISTSKMGWQDIGGLSNAKSLLMENIVIAGLKKPDSIKPWKGVLLFGPPGTGKSLLASACAGSLDATFFNVGCDKLLSKYFGESSKLISSLYSVAKEKSPSIVFIDEFDSISLSRGEDSSEASRKMLSTLLSELEGFNEKKKDLFVLTLAATNTPWDLDQAVLSRFSKKIYIPLPDVDACAQIINIHTKGLESKVDVKEIAKKCVDKYLSGRDIRNLCQEAIWNMVRGENNSLQEMANLPFEEIKKRSLKTRPIVMQDFEEALKKVRSPVSAEDIKKYEKWNEDGLENLNKASNKSEWEDLKEKININISNEIEKIIAGTDIKPPVLESTFKIAYEISREGREGKPIGTSFVIGDSKNVLARSRQLVTNPLGGVQPSEKMITDPEFNGTIKEFAQNDGAFVISDDGVVEAACRQLTADATNVNIPRGHGTRHSSMAAMTMATRSVGIVVSQSGGKITIIKEGKFVKSFSP